MHCIVARISGETINSQINNNNNKTLNWNEEKIKEGTFDKVISYFIALEKHCQCH
jgi:hypothetical protein